MQEHKKTAAEKTIEFKDPNAIDPNSPVMPDSLFQTLWEDAFICTDPDAYVSDWALDYVWGDDPEDEIPEARIEMLRRLWDVAHCSILDIRQHAGLTQKAFSERYLIPKRTIGNWETGANECPDYLRLLLAEASGMYHRPNKTEWEVPGKEKTESN